MMMYTLFEILAHWFLVAFILIFFLLIIGIIIFLIRLAYEILYSITNNKVFSISVLIVFMLISLGIGTNLTFLS